jgi:hypothetical protein
VGADLDKDSAKPCANQKKMNKKRARPLNIMHYSVKYMHLLAARPEQLSTP